MKQGKAARQAGFSLMELIIVVMILMVLVAIALPAYQEYVAKGRRAEAAAALLEGAQFLERHYSANGTYLDGGALPAGVPTRVPANGPVTYNIAAVGAPTASTFTLRATRAGTMVGDACGDLQIDHTGARSMNGATKPRVECWRN